MDDIALLWKKIKSLESEIDKLQKNDVPNFDAAFNFGNTLHAVGNISTDGSISSDLDMYPFGDAAGVSTRLHSYIDPGSANLWKFDTGTRPLGWAVADSPFVAFGSEVYQNSYAYLGYATAANSRSFLYRSQAPQNYAWLKTQMGVQTVDCQIGFRCDDGTDNNFAEFVVGYVSPVAYYLEMRWRVGGGTVSTSRCGNTLCFSNVLLLVQYSGTLWSSWSAVGMVSLPGSSIHTEPTGTATGTMTWTPTRSGIVLNKGNSTVTWYITHSDFIFI